MRSKPVFQNTTLQELAQYGVAFHHAGLEYTDRKAVEDGFRDGSLFALVSTSVSGSDDVENKPS